MIDVNVDLVVDALRELADEAFQRDVWLGSSDADVMSSFTECVSRLFDDSGLSIELEKSRTLFSKEIDELIADLDSRLAKVDTRRSPVEIINDPEMTKIRALARELSHRLSE